MDFKAFILSTLFISFLALLDSGTALKCYWCNSKNDSHCDKITSDAHVVNCEDKVKVLNPPSGNYTLCRKTVITLPTSEKRTVRTCGWDAYKKYPCYYTTTMDVKSSVCECFSDSCNSAPQSVAAAATFTLFLSTMATFIIRS